MTDQPHNLPPGCTDTDPPQRRIMRHFVSLEATLPLSVELMAENAEDAEERTRELIDRGWIPALRKLPPMCGVEIGEPHSMRVEEIGEVT